MIPVSFLTRMKIRETRKILLPGLLTLVLVLAIINLPTMKEWYNRLTQTPKISAQKEAHLDTLYKTAGQKYDIPWEYLKAINKVETNFGLNTGKYKVLDVLEKSQRDDFYQICSENGTDPCAVKGSKAGAIGFMQFMPETWQKYKDASGNPPFNPWDEEDAIFTAAMLLSENGGKEEIYRAIWHYNPDPDYVDEVTTLAALYSHSSREMTAQEDREDEAMFAAATSLPSENDYEEPKVIDLKDTPDLKPSDIQINWWFDNSFNLGQVYKSADPSTQDLLLFSVLAIDKFQNDTRRAVGKGLDEINHKLR